MLHRKSLLTRSGRANPLAQHTLMAAQAFTFPTNFLPGATKPNRRGSWSLPPITHVRPWSVTTNCSSLISPAKLHKGTELGLDDKDTDSILLENPAFKSMGLPHLRARSLALQSVGIKGVALQELIRKCPHVLLGEEIDTLISFVCEELQGEIEPESLERLFSSTEGRLLTGFAQKVKLLLHHGVPPEKILHILNKVSLSKAFCIRSVEEVDRILTFMKPYRGIDVIMKRPAILGYDLNAQIIPRVEFLYQLSGGDEDATGAVLVKLPALLNYTVEHMDSHVEFLKSYAGLNQQQIFKVILVFPNLMSASKERKLQPRIEFLKQCNLDSTELFKFMTRAPLFLALSFKDNIVHKLGFLVKIGYAFRTKEFTMALGAVTRTSCENMQQVIELFLSYGLSYEEILSMSKKHPQVLQYNPSSLEQKLDYLLEEMGREIEEVLAFPAFLGYKLDDRIKHRYEEKRKTRGDGMSLIKLLSVSTLRFSKQKKEPLSVQD